jgi:hypothetical protein
MSVDIKNLKACIAKAKRFLTRANECLEDIHECTKKREALKPDWSGPWPDLTKCSSVRRSSMDLTRALAALRDYRR